MTRIASTRLIGIPHSAVAITPIEYWQSGKMKGRIGLASDAGPTLPTPFTEETFSVESCDRLPRISLERLPIDVLTVNSANTSAFLDRYAGSCPAQTQGRRCLGRLGNLASHWRLRTCLTLLA